MYRDGTNIWTDLSSPFSVIVFSTFFYRHITPQSGVKSSVHASYDGTFFFLVKASYDGTCLHINGPHI